MSELGLNQFNNNESDEALLSFTFYMQSFVGHSFPKDDHREIPKLCTINNFTNKNGFPCLRIFKEKRQYLIN